jgi:hypothetical protein
MLTVDVVSDEQQALRKENSAVLETDKLALFTEVVQKSHRVREIRSLVAASQGCDCPNTRPLVM